VHQWAIRNGEMEFGVTVHVMVTAIDAGPIVARRRFPVRPDDTGLSLFRRCNATAIELLAEVATRVARGESVTESPQDLSRRCVYRHRDALDGAIDWRLPARAVVDFVRAGNYEPAQSPTYVASMESKRGVTVEVLRACVEASTSAPAGSVFGISHDGPLITCGDGNSVRLTRARLDGKILQPSDWLAFFSGTTTPKERG
jgi:methionyl-tRNA formyltransferase